MRHEVKTFAQCMEHKLKKNDHKGGWEGMTNERLFQLLRQEVDELEAALKDEPDLNVVFEAADIANFAMMLGWNALRRMVNPFRASPGGAIARNNIISHCPPNYHNDKECDYAKTGICECCPF